jgi:hypothetical protein
MQEMMPSCISLIRTGVKKSPAGFEWIVTNHVQLAATLHHRTHENWGLLDLVRPYHAERPVPRLAGIGAGCSYLELVAHYWSRHIYAAPAVNLSVKWTGFPKLFGRYVPDIHGLNDKWESFPQAINELTSHDQAKLAEVYLSPGIDCMELRVLLVREMDWVLASQGTNPGKAARLRATVPSHFLDKNNKALLRFFAAHPQETFEIKELQRSKNSRFAIPQDRNVLGQCCAALKDLLYVGHPPNRKRGYIITNEGRARAAQIDADEMPV